MTCLRRSLAIVVATLLAVGCSPAPKSRPLPPGAFSPGRGEKPVDVDPLSRVDQPGQLGNTGRGVTGAKPAPPDDPTLLARIRQNDGRLAIDQTDAADPAPASGPTTTAATSPSTQATGQYLTLGGVVMEVNGAPIYANEILKAIEPLLAKRAKDLDQNQFRTFAQRAIAMQTMRQRDLQLLYAAAERELDQKDKDMVEMLTMQWRQKEIASAGGSETVARQRAAARGENFDDLAQQEHRKWMRSLYEERKIRPRILVSADDIRSYYERNRNREFTEQGTATFRLIKIDPAKHGGREPAEKLAAELRARVVNAGESFEAVARSVNDDPRFLASGGALGSAIQKGAFAITPVENAVWTTDVGQVTPVVEAGGVLYLAYVEAKTAGKVQSFDDEAVQSKIEAQLRDEQSRAAYQKIIESLGKDAVWRTERQWQTIPLDMAMQNYARWAKEDDKGTR